MRAYSLAMGDLVICRAICVYHSHDFWLRSYMGQIVLFKGSISIGPCVAIWCMIFCEREFSSRHWHGFSLFGCGACFADLVLTVLILLLLCKYSYIFVY